MSYAFIVGHLSVKDAEKWARYRASVPATLQPWGGELMFRGRKAEVLLGEHPHTDTVAIRFPDLAALKGWHDSPAYQALVPLRTEATEGVLIAYEGPQEDGETVVAT